MYKNRETTRINLSKTGGIGVKCARVSVNKKGVQTQVGAKGAYYMKDYRLKSDNNRKKHSTYTSEGPMIVNTEPGVKLCKNVAKARKVHTSLSIAMYLCSIIGITKPLFLIVSTALVSYLYINKNAKQRMYVSTAAYNLQALKLDKAKNFFEKARNIFDNELVQELENDINNAENILS